MVVKTKAKTKKKAKDEPKKKCAACEEERKLLFFYKVNSPIFPDGRIHICRDCVREQVDIDDLEQVIGFLRQIDKPFVKQYWTEAVNSGRYALGEYIRKVNSLVQLKDKNFDNSDGMSTSAKTSDIQIVTMSDTIENVKGEVIEYSDELIDKWGIGYKKHEYLKMEKFYQDMRLTHEIHTPIHVDMLTQLSYMSVERDRLRQGGDWNNYSRISKTIEDMTKSAGFRPVDRQGIDDATGIRSFSQIFEEVEKRGFRKPPPVTFDEDVVDQIVISLSNYYHRLVGKQILTEVPEEVKEELNSFYEDDLTPVEINEEEEYDEIDFSIDDENEESDVER